MNAPPTNICQCEPYRPCAACEAITDLEQCDVCGEVAYSWPRCTACGTCDIGYLHSRVKLAPVVRDIDPQTGNERVAA